MTASASLVQHLYVWVDRAAIRRGGQGYERAVWFGLHAHPGRAWGCHVMLECGAIYRNLPPHVLAFSEEPVDWTLPEAQLWDCYGRDFALIRYDYLSTLDGIASIDKRDVPVSYLFTSIPFGDGFSESPDQSKEFMFLRTAGDRLTVQPTNRVLFAERSFTTQVAWPKDLVRQEQVYSCENEL